MPRAPDAAIAERDDGTIPPAAAAAAAQAAFVPVPLPRILAYVATSIFIALTQGFAQGLVPAVLPQIAGQRDVGLGYGQPSGVGLRHDGGFDHGGMLDEHTLEFER